MITLRKICTGYYEVYQNNNRIGELIKEHRKGTGRSSRGFAGYVPPYSQWELWLDDRDNVIIWDDITKLSDVKARLNQGEF